MIDTLTVTRDCAERLSEMIGAAGLTGWEVVTDIAAPRVADTRVVELRLVSCTPVVNGLSTYRLDCQVVVRGRVDNEALAAVTSSDLSALFGAAVYAVQLLPGNLVEISGRQVAQYLDARLDQLASGVLPASMQVAPVGSLVLWVHFSDEDLSDDSAE